MATATARIAAPGADPSRRSRHRRLCGGSNVCQFAVNAGARGTGLRGRLTAADRMNLNWLMPAKGGSYMPHSHSRKVYLTGSRADIRVPMREIALSGGYPP